MNKKGFTLIELLVVIAIIGTLSTLAVVSLGGARVKARDTKRLNDIKQVQNALEMYFNDWEHYPTSTGIILGDTNNDCLAPGGFVPVATCPTDDYYMNGVPKDPISGMDYTYYGGTTTYSITAVLESGAGGFIAGPVTATPNGLQGTR